MPRLGAHMSIAGGLPRAVDRAALHGCEALQIFTKSCGQWRARPLPPEEVAAFRARSEETGIGPAIAHASYLINLGTADETLRLRSVGSLGEEIDRAESLGLAGVVLHPGAATSGDDAAAIALVGRSLREVLRPRRRGRVRILLEHTAGQGRSLGWRFEQLAAMIEAVEGHARIGVCLDTCHLVAAGYALHTDRGYADTMRAFGRSVGFDRLAALHLNDSKTPLGSRVDRHAHIGEGAVGLEAFRRIVNDRRFAGLPMVIETPKTISKGTGVAHDALDARNLATLRSLIARD